MSIFFFEGKHPDEYTADEWGINFSGMSVYELKKTVKLAFWATILMKIVNNLRKMIFLRRRQLILRFAWTGIIGRSWLAKSRPR